MAPLLATTYSWIAVTTLTPLTSLILAWTIISIHRKRHLKSILLLSILYSQLLLQIFNFCHSILNLLKLNLHYTHYLNYVFTILILFKSLSVLSCHFEEFYKYKYPSNYLLNVNSSLLKYHLLVLFLLSLMTSYLFRNIDFIPLVLNSQISYDAFGNPSFHQTPAMMIFGDKLELVVTFLVFHTFIIFASFGFVLIKCVVRHKTSCSNSSLDVNIIGTNSTSSSTNLFSGGGGCSGGGGDASYKNNVQSRTKTTVGIVNLMINLSLVVCTFSNFWLPSLSLSLWPITNIITWSQVIESILTPIAYSLVQLQYHRHRHHQGGKGSHGHGRGSNCSSSSNNSNASVIYHHNNNAGGRHHNAISSGSGHDHYNRHLHNNLPSHHHHPLQFHNHRFPATNGSLCFNNGEFQYFAGSKNSTSILNNASEYNTFDSSIHQTQSTYSKDSLRCASVTTIANDDFEFLSRREEQLLHNHNNHSSSNNIVASNNISQIGLQQLLSSAAAAGPSAASQEAQEVVVGPSPISMSAGNNNNNLHRPNLLQHYYHHNNLNSSISNVNQHSFRQRAVGELTTIPSSSLSMNDLDLIADDDDDFDSTLLMGATGNGARDGLGLGLLGSSNGGGTEIHRSSINGNSNNNNRGIASNNTNSGVNNKCKYKKNSNYCIKRRFPNSSSSSNSNYCNVSSNNGSSKSGLTRRVLSLESLHSHNVNESHLAYLDTGERVIVFTTDYI